MIHTRGSWLISKPWACLHARCPSDILCEATLLHLVLSLAMNHLVLYCEAWLLSSWSVFFFHQSWMLPPWCGFRIWASSGSRVHGSVVPSCAVPATSCSFCYVVGLFGSSPTWRSSFALFLRCASRSTLKWLDAAWSPPWALPPMSIFLDKCNPHFFITLL